MLKPSTNDAGALALAALAATLSDERRALRFLDLTGLNADELRARVLSGDSSILAALVDFLCAHEPDLLAVADAIGLDPATLAGLGEHLS